MQTKKKNKKQLVGFGALGILAAFLLFIPTAAFAQFNLDSNLPNLFGIAQATDLTTTIIAVVQWILAIVGLIAVVIIIYGGVIWMTARGEADKIRKAKKILLNAAIGLAIILLAWVIVAFIVDFVADTAGGLGGGCNTPGAVIGCQVCNGATGNWDPIPNCPAVPGANYFVRSHSPLDGATNVKLCESVNAYFWGVVPPDIDPNSVNATNVIISDTTDPLNPINVGVDANFSAPAGSNGFGYRAVPEWEANHDYTVQVTNGVQSASGVGATTKIWSYTTGTESDDEPPVVDNWSPQGPDICLTPQLYVKFNEPMFAGSFNRDNITISPADANVVRVIGSVDSFVAELDQPLQGNTTYSVTLNAELPDGFQDTCGNGLDCGNGTDICTSDGTATGTTADNFSWTFTTKDTTETDCRPEITRITPAVGDYSASNAQEIVIEGLNLGVDANFGAIDFTNKFYGNDIEATNVTGDQSRCMSPEDGGTPGRSFKPNTNPSVACVQSWTNQAIRTIVPAGGVSLAALGSGATGGDVNVLYGTQRSDPNNGFVDVSSPHIARIVPTSGGVGQFVTLVGEHFGAPGAVYLVRESDGYEVEAQTCDPNSWQTNQIVIEIPSGTNFNVGDEILVQVDTDPGAANDGNDRSNVQKFILTSDPPTPGICSVLPNPACHNEPGQTLQINGKYLDNIAAGYYQAHLGNAPTIYQASNVNNVNDTRVDITSPNALPNDRFSVYVVNATNQVSNSFNYYDVPCAPGGALVYSNACDLGATPQVFPSPNPYPDSQNICINMNNLSFRFSEQMNILPSNISLHECTAGRAACATSFNPVGFTVTSATPTDEVHLSLPVNLNPDTWYEVSVSGDVRNLSNIRLGDDQVWYFKTRADATECAADQLALTAVDNDGLAPMYTDATSTSDHQNEIRYNALPTTSSCQVINSPGDYTWNSSLTNIASCWGGNCALPDSQMQLYQTQGDEGTTRISVQHGNLSAFRDLRVILNYCQKNSDCNKTITIGGTPTLCSSTCNLAQQRCEPHTVQLSTTSGPAGQPITIRGCYYGPNQGRVLFDTDEANYFCGVSTWSPDGTQVIVKAPDTLSVGDTPDVVVETNANIGQLQSNPITFTVTNQCNGQPVPATGIPGVCSISPTAGVPGQGIAIRGEDFPVSNATGSIEFQGATAPSADTTWDSLGDLVTSRVPVGALSGDVTVVAGGTCPSNPVQFTVSCNNNGQCASGCCQAGACVAAGLCSTGGVGQACQIDITPAHPSASCLSGPTTAADPDYLCIDTLGFTADKAPTAPPPNQGDLCQFCCDPDQNSDGSIDDPQTTTLTNLTCTPLPAGSGICSSATGVQTRGLYCGCTNNNQCGTGTACSTQNDPGGRCCRPVTTASMPAEFACLNSALEINFTDPMDRSSLNASTVIFTQGGGPLSGRYITGGNRLLFMPNAPLADATVNVIINSGARNIYGIPLTNAIIGLSTDPGTDAEICKVSDVAFTWSTSAGTYVPPSLFTCAKPDGCVGDYDGSTPGNQQQWTAVAVDSQGNQLADNSGRIVYHWEEQDAQDIYSVEASCANDTGAAFGCALTSNPKNGNAYLYVSVSDADPNDGFDYGSAARRASIRTFMCESPWPNPYLNPFPYEDSTYNGAQVPNWDFNFSLAYCRSEGGLPDLRIGSIQGGITAPLVDSRSVSIPGVDELLRQYAFFVTDDIGNRIGSDTIGMRVMENELNLPPDLWYRRTIGEDPNGALMTVDGFPAMRVGRSTYIAAVNVDLGSGNMYPNMYVLSYSDGATAQTVNIYNQLLKNISFTNNVAEADRAPIRRDVNRTQDLRRSGIAASDYFKRNGAYPALTSGSYINSFSVSTWPSWNSTLSGALQQQLPTDPFNTINMCSLSFRSSAYTETGATTWLSGVAVDSQGQVYAVSYTGDRSLFKCDGNLTACQSVYTFPATEQPVGVDVDVSTGDVLVAAQNAGIVRFDPNNFSTPKATYALGGSSSAAHVTTDPVGNLYVTRTNASNGIYKYDRDGNPTGVQISYAGSCNDGFSPCPRGVDFVDGLLYVVDQRTKTVTAYNENLQMQNQITLPMTAVDVPLGLSVFGNSIYVTNHQNGSSIWEIARDLSGVLNIAQDGNLANPYEVAVNGTGVYVANYSAHRIDRYAKNESASSTCWDEASSQFNASSGSHVYAYSYQGGDPAFYANLEYLGPGTWSNIGPDFDACSGFANGTCPTFNYIWDRNAIETWVSTYQNTGIPDTTAPTINSFTIPNPITGLSTLTVSATDTGSGNGRAEFFVNNVLKYTDYTNDFTWDFDPASYVDGTYAFFVRVHDKAGNYTDSVVQNIQIQKAVTDQTPPSLTAFQHGTNPVSGNVNLSVTVTDAGGSGMQKVEYYIGTEFIGRGTTGPGYNFIWDSTTKGDGSYPIYAVAFDGAGNTAIRKETIVTNNGIDTQAPSVSITSPSQGAEVSGTIQISAQAADNQGVQDVTAYLIVGGVETQIPDMQPSPNPDTTPPYSWVWNTLPDPRNPSQLLPAGTPVTIRVVARDIASPANSREATITVTVNNVGTTNPTAWFIDPQDGEIFQPGQFNMYAFDSVGIDYVEVYAYDNAQFGVPSAEHFLGSVTTGSNPYQIGWDNSLPDGRYGLRVIAVNTNGFSSDPTDPGAQIEVIIDRTAPTITNFTPPAGTTLTGTETFTITSNDLNGISHVSLVYYRSLPWQYAGASCLPTPPATGNYTCTIDWNTQLNPAVPDGDAYVIALVRDPANNSASLAHAIVVDNSSGGGGGGGTGPDTTPPDDPVISYSPAPTNGFHNGTETVTVTASDTGGSGIAYVDLWINGVLQDNDSDGHTCTSSPCNWVQWDTTTVSDGTHTLEAEATDGDGNVSNRISETVNVDNFSPLASWSQPAQSYYVAGIILLSVNATDGPTPPASGITRVEFFHTDPVDPANKIGEDTIASSNYYELYWTTNALVDGDYDLYAVATDQAGNQTTAGPRAIHINNTNPTFNCGTNLCGGSTPNCCGTQCYNPTTHQCCNGIVQVIGSICIITQPS